MNEKGKTKTYVKIQFVPHRKHVISITDVICR